MCRVGPTACIHVYVSKLMPMLFYSVIFVHGLNGGAAKTWRHPDGHIWFADFLPADVVDEDSWTNARIWTYGYDAETTFDTFNTSTDSARNLLYKVARIRERNEVGLIWTKG